MEETTASKQIDRIIQAYGGWKGDILSQLRDVIHQADPDIDEEIKWKMATRPEGLPVWSHDGIVCFAETWKDNVKLIFAKGSQLADPDRLFNARLKSAAVRAIEFREGDSVNGTALENLVREAAEINESKKN